VEILPGDASDELNLAAVRHWNGLPAADALEVAVQFRYQGEGADSLAAR
jgi:hypothetical protein